MRLIIIIASLLLPAQLSAQEVRTLGDQSSPPATIDQISWLAGGWQGTGPGGDAHESWLPPVAGQMAGVFHLVQDEEVQFYEIMQMVSRGGSLMLRLKHFHGDLSGWEDNSAESAIEFPLVAIEGNTAYFSGLTYQLVDEDTLHVFLRLHDNGESWIATFEFERIG